MTGTDLKINEEETSISPTAISSGTAPAGGNLSDQRFVTTGDPIDGKIALEIGTGVAANDSFVYLTIKWCFLIGFVTSGALFVKSFFPDMQGASGVEIFKGVWSIFLPVITLALGYSFGKGR